MDYPKIVKELREKLLLSQVEMAKLLNVSFLSINRWENARTKPVYAARRKIVELCKENNIDIGDVKYEKLH